MPSHGTASPTTPKNVGGSHSSTMMDFLVTFYMEGVKVMIITKSACSYMDCLLSSFKRPTIPSQKRALFQNFPWA